MGILDWWRKRDGKGKSAQDKRKIEQTVERIVQTTNPKLRFASRYRARLSPAVATSLDYLQELVASQPPAREASAAAWPNDPYLRAFFASADDLVKAFSHSDDLRGHFERNPLDNEAYVSLGMIMVENQILGMAIEGDSVRRDVAQTTVSFGDYRIRLCGRSDADLRDEIERRLMDQLALEGMARIAADETQRTALQEERALIKARLQLLERQGTGMRGAMGGEAVSVTDQASLKAELDKNSMMLDGIGGGPDRLDHELDNICAVLADPAAHLYVSSKHLRLDRMNVVVADNNSAEGTDLEFLQVRIPGVVPAELRAFCFMRFPRTDLLPVGHLFEKTVKELI